jgi:hypothetical protein
MAGGGRIGDGCAGGGGGIRLVTEIEQPAGVSARTAAVAADETRAVMRTDFRTILHEIRTKFARPLHADLPTQPT